MRFRATALALAMTGILLSAIAPCFAAATSADMQQMACCKAGLKACGTHGEPADCCRTASQASQFTPAGKVVAAPKSVPIHIVAAVVASPSSLSHAQGFADPTSPPRGKHPTFLALSTLRL